MSPIRRTASRCCPRLMRPTNLTGFSAVDGSDWDPFTRTLLFTQEVAGTGAVVEITPEWPAEIRKLDGIVGRAGDQGVVLDDNGERPARSRMSAAPRRTSSGGHARVRRPCVNSTPSLTASSPTTRGTSVSAAGSSRSRSGSTARRSCSMRRPCWARFADAQRNSIRLERRGR